MFYQSQDYPDFDSQTKAKNQKTEMTHKFGNLTLNFASQNEKPKIKFLIEPTALTSCLPDT
ncbi:hypothetical protein BOO29_19605 [Vibrio navarrensis]|nr:hypothetical protein [Vibrio navarrensis]MBE4583211.1 hypothetical protein [Vibrio navarrensis]MBE4587078.1 hypothetical protein [Vibrio navarrensis]MBE4590722.1 hypothetical protein [Vibrio navarrensis]MBE4598460.1 hypothetical protein [Vibrio navarrensis]